MQIYPEFILRITLLLRFCRTTRECFMRQNDDRYRIQRAIGCPHLVGAREPDVLLFGNPCLQPSMLLTAAMTATLFSSALAKKGIARKQKNQCRIDLISITRIASPDNLRPASLAAEVSIMS
jgi:hypothetical protein